KVIDRVAAIAQPREMRDFLRRLKSKSKRFRGKLAPIRDRFRCRNAVEGVINFRGIESFGVKRKHLRRRQILWVKASLPFRILESRSANPLIHQLLRTPFVTRTSSATTWSIRFATLVSMSLSPSKESPVA